MLREMRAKHTPLVLMKFATNDVLVVGGAFML